MFSFKYFRSSWRYAWAGLRHAYRSQQNFRLQILAAILVVVAGFYFRISRQEWVILCLLIGMVLILELFNTVFEALVDILKPKIHDYVKVFKDLLAAMVLLASLVAVVIGVVIFYPYIIRLVE